MVGVGETYLPAFVLAVSRSSLACGLTATIPLVLGSLLQLIAPQAVRWAQSYRRWVVATAVLQAVVFVPLAGAAIVGAMPVWLAFAIAAVYWACGLGASGAWNAWVGTLVPQRIRTAYFARRTAVTQIAVFCGLVTGGLLLQAGARLGRPLTAFGVIFGLAFLSRIASAWFLTKQTEPVKPESDLSKVRLVDVLRAIRRHPTGRILLYLFAVQASVQISGPFFTPFMLKQLALSYTQYVLLLAVAYVSKVAALPFLGRMAERYGSHRLLWVGGLAIVPVAGLWNVSQSYSYLCAVQLLSGIAWGAYEFAMLLIFFQAIPRQRRVSVLTIYNLANSTAILAGSLLGGALLTWFAATREAFLLLFLLSSALRFVSLGVLTWAQSGRSFEAIPDRMPTGDPEPATSVVNGSRAAIVQPITGPIPASGGAPLTPTVALRGTGAISADPSASESVGDETAKACAALIPAADASARAA
ncbi:MAG: MFS transporter [Planctomycetota bacterium]